MLATWTGNEARVTAFLATWLVERYWLASALRDLLPTDPADADDPPHRPAGVRGPAGVRARVRSEEHTSELQSRGHLVCRLLLEKKKKHRDTPAEVIVGTPRAALADP